MLCQFLHPYQQCSNRRSTNPKLHLCIQSLHGYSRFQCIRWPLHTFWPSLRWQSSGRSRLNATTQDHWPLQMQWELLCLYYQFGHTGFSIIQNWACNRLFELSKSLAQCKAPILLFLLCQFYIIAPTNHSFQIFLSQGKNMKKVCFLQDIITSIKALMKILLCFLLPFSCMHRKKLKHKRYFSLFLKKWIKTYTNTQFFAKGM